MTTPLRAPSVRASACCAAVTAGAMGADDARLLAHMLKALSDPSRVRMLSMIAAHPDGEACVCELTELVGLSQPTVSHHMKQLVDAGLVTREQRGRWAYYAVVPATLSMLSAVLDPHATRTGAAGRATAPPRPRDPAALRWTERTSTT